MAKQFQRIEPLHRQFIERQRIFFNASAAAEGHVNVSPRDGAALRVLTANTVVYLDRTGSGNETAAHLLANGRLTLMFCAFEGPPLILRLYGQGRVVRRHSSEYDELLASEFGGVEPPGARQMVHLDIDLVQLVRLWRAAVRLCGRARSAHSLGRGKGRRGAGGVLALEK